MQSESLLCRLHRAFRPTSAGSTRAAYPNLPQQLVVERLDQVWAVDMTYIRLPQGLIHHSDRGVQYASGEYVARLSEIGACPFMSKAGCPS